MKKLLGSALLTAFLATSAQAQTITFEGIDQGAQIGNYYHGGGGPNYGVDFSDSAFPIQSEKVPCTGFFSIAGQPSGCGVITLSDVSAYMNRSDGFIGAISFYYSAIQMPLTVSIFSGMSGSGSLLATKLFPITPSTPNTTQCADEMFCPFFFSSLSFNGLGHSVVFAQTTSGQVGIDDITFTPAPEPASYAMMGMGLLAVGVASRRRRKV